MKRILLVCTGTLLITSCLCKNKISRAENQRGDMRILFYNVENLFDPKNDSLKMDEDFTPAGAMYWSWKRYKDKARKVAQVVLGVGGWEVPEIVGLCEVENRYVLEGLTRHTALAGFGYEIIHYESPDLRGIDVALLYQKRRFRPLYTEALPVKFRENSARPTRDILYVRGVTHTYDTLHVFVNHWSSKRDGFLETEYKRNQAAATLRVCVDSIFSENPLAKIIIMGDFNTESETKPLKEHLKVVSEVKNLQEKTLYNLSHDWSRRNNYGSHKHQGIWGTIDHIIVSYGLLAGEGILETTPDDAHVYFQDFLLEDDQLGGKKPFRTYIGMRYNGGFSDHLPIYLDLRRK